MAREHVLAVTGKRPSSNYKLPVVERLTVRLLQVAWKGDKLMPEQKSALT